MAGKPLTPEQRILKSQKNVKKTGYALIVYGIVLLPIVLFWGQGLLRFMPVPFFESLILKKASLLIITSLWVVVVGYGFLRQAKWAFYLCFVFIGLLILYLCFMAGLGYLSLDYLPSFLQNKSRYIAMNLTSLALACVLIYYQMHLAWEKA